MEPPAEGQRPKPQELNSPAREVLDAINAKTTAEKARISEIIINAVPINQAVHRAFVSYSQSLSRLIPQGWIFIGDFKRTVEPDFLLQKVGIKGAAIEALPYRLYFLPEAAETYRLTDYSISPEELTKILGPDNKERIPHWDRYAYDRETIGNLDLPKNNHDLDDIRKSNPDRFAKTGPYKREAGDEISREEGTPYWDGTYYEEKLLEMIERTLPAGIQNNEEVNAAREEFLSQRDILKDHGKDQDEELGAVVKQRMINILSVVSHYFKLPDVLRLGYEDKTNGISICLFVKDGKLVRGRLDPGGFFGLLKPKVEDATDLGDRYWTIYSDTILLAVLNAVPGLKQQIKKPGDNIDLLY